MALREWVREDVGLLDDDRYIEMPDNLLAAWEVLMKITARLPGERFKDRKQMAFQLRRYGRPRAEAAVKGLDSLGWIVDVDDGGVRLRGWDKYQLRYSRGSSDDPVRKAERNANRPTTDAERKANAKPRTFADAMADAGLDPNAIGKRKPRAALDGAAPATVESGGDRAV